MNNYTGREIAVFTDIHGLLHPTIAILQDIRRRGIKEIYSLGDAIGVGPSPSEVLNLLGEHDVKCINGNSEEYSVIGIEPFAVYFNEIRKLNQKWTLDRLTSSQLRLLANNRHSYELMVGGLKIAFCHFINDVRIDFSNRSTWSYQESVNSGLTNPQAQFYYTNSKEQKEEVKLHAASGLPQDKGYLSASIDPLFNGKTVDNFNEIFQGHVHFKMLTSDETLKVRTLRAVGMGYQNNQIDMASYIIIKEKNKGYDVEEILVPFRRDLMLKSIDQSTIPYKNRINKFVSRR